MASPRCKDYEKLVSAQHLYNLVRRDIEREILPACDAEGLGMICWSPLAAGMLTGKYRGAEKPDAEFAHRPAGRDHAAALLVRRVAAR